MNSVIKTAAKITHELSQPNARSNAREEWNTTHKGKIGRVPTEKMEKQSNGWAVH